MPAPHHPPDGDGLARAIAEGRLPPGWQVEYHPATPSTQDLARAAARAGRPGRSVFVADFQSQGRGRQGRTWIAPPGSSLMLSILFREDAAPAAEPHPLRYTRLVAVALAEAIERVAPPLRPAIKWPNDLLLGDRKVAGVLAEAAWDGERLAVVVGAGTNVDLPDTALAALPPTATSLRAARPDTPPPDRADLLAALLAGMDAWLARPDADLATAWRARLWGRGQQLRLRGLEGADAEHEVEAVVLDAESDGALVVRLPHGAIVRTTTAELLL